MEEMSFSSTTFLKTLIPVFVPFFVLLLSVVSAQNLLHVERAEVKTRIADKALMSHTNVLSKLFNHCSVSLSVHSITNDKIYAHHFKRLADEIPHELESFKQLPVHTAHQTDLKEQVEKYTEEGLKTINGALLAFDDRNVADDVKQLRAKELYTSITSHSQQLHETAQEIGKGVISEEREKGHSHRRIKYVSSILVAYLLALVLLAIFSKHMAKLVEKKKGVSIARKIFVQGVMAVFLPIFALSCLVVFLTDRVHRAENEVRKLVRDIAIIEHGNAVSDLVYEVRLCSSGYSVTKHSHLSDRFDAALSKIPGEIADLRELFVNQADQLKLIDKLEQTVNSQTKQLMEKRDLLRDDKVEVVKVPEGFTTTHYLADQAHDIVGELTEPARKIEEESAYREKTSSPGLIVAGITILSAFAGLFLGFLYSKTLSRYFSSDF